MCLAFSVNNNYMDNELQRLKVASGVETLILQGTGVYHFRLSDSVKNVSTCSIVSSPGQKVSLLLYINKSHLLITIRIIYYYSKLIDIQIVNIFYLVI